MAGRKGLKSHKGLIVFVAGRKGLKGHKGHKVSKFWWLAGKVSKVTKMSHSFCGWQERSQMSQRSQGLVVFVAGRKSLNCHKGHKGLKVLVAGRKGLNCHKGRKGLKVLVAGRKGLKGHKKVS